MSRYQNKTWQKLKEITRSDAYKLRIAGEESIDFEKIALMKQEEKDKRARMMKEDLMVKLGQQIQPKDKITTDDLIE